MSEFERELRAELQAEAMEAAERAGANRVEAQRLEREAQRLEREADGLQEYADGLLGVARTLETKER